MFAKNSRYVAQPTVTTQRSDGTEVQAVKLRRLPPTSGEEYRVSDSSQLDVVSQQKYKDATRYWHIADANSELQAGALMATSGRVIELPKR